MADSKLVDNVILTLIARFAIVFASTVGLPAAFWMMNRAVNSVDVISTKIDTLRDQQLETGGALKLMQQIQTADHHTLEDHEARLRGVETRALRAN